MSKDVLLVREGGKLGAYDAISAEAILGINANEVVTASFRRERNPKHHRKLFALLKVCLDNQDFYTDERDLLEELKMATGLFKVKKRRDGTPYIVMDSISFAAMDQSRFEKWYEAAVGVICTSIIPNVNRKEFEDQIHEILNHQARH